MSAERSSFRGEGGEAYTGCLCQLCADPGTSRTSSEGGPTLLSDPGQVTFFSFFSVSSSGKWALEEFTSHSHEYQMGV